LIKPKYDPRNYGNNNKRQTCETCDGVASLMTVYKKNDKNNMTCYGFVEKENMQMHLMQSKPGKRKR